MILRSWLASLVRGGAGASVAATLGPRPARPLELYEFEACPYCRKVREMVTFLDLPVLIWPCPKGGERFRPRAVAIGGAARFPLLVDPDRGLHRYESDAIVRDLAHSYGTGVLPLALRWGPLTTVTSGLASAVAGVGRHARPSRPAAAPLELVGFEASPGARLVRGALCELELPYRLSPSGHGSPSRAALVAAGSAPTLPVLRDPNTGASHAGAAAITAYLEATYALPT